MTDPNSDLVVYAARLIRAMRRIDVPGSSGPGLRILSLLDQHGPSSVGDLARLDSSAQASMSGAVAGMLEQGLVAKEPDPRDRRASIVSLTPAGVTELARGRAFHARVVAARLAETGHDSAAVARAVDVLRDLVAEPLHDPDLPHPDEGATTSR